MGNAGSADNLIVNSGWILKQGTDTYILKNTLTLDISRPRFRDAIDIGPVNTFGAGDHSVPAEFEADISKAANWANLNARNQLTGFLPNLPYTLTMQSKPFTDGGSLPTVTVSLTDGKISSTNISAAGSNIEGSILLALSGGSPDRPGKIVGIVSEGSLIEVIVIDVGEGYGSTPSVTESFVTSPVAFAFNAEVSTVSFSQSESEGRLKIDAVLTITDDAVLPVDA